MVIAIIGESCTGKSTIAEKLKTMLNAEVFTGKDYMRLAKNEDAAKKIFREKMGDATSEAPIIYVISEKEHLGLLPEKAFRILATAELDMIKERFARRMHGNLPASVADMLERKHGCFDSVDCDIHVRSGEGDLDEICLSVRNAIMARAGLT